ncbi:fluoride efflux transporter CrcB [Ureibacillus aquaedulcis]|uniref:Fluoride-specific ion channel FluC n=1 Tax=Ureibacillus aquaedulcis TaxID=3058421 RepID=A0ABT8GPS0_9BACL|nr:fluoride efflux transporter CrcB [Ureibacillus sp. BA0131]MDN4493413.1 fluoride efflux transporter CrcB [Ureibacillus sp. BA0131]
MEWIIVALGGGVGATLRYFVQLWIGKMKLPSYCATAIVNILGSFILGITSHIMIESSSLMAFLTMGVLGAFTTFSTFAFDIVKLMEVKNRGMAFLFIAVNLVGGILAFWLGWIL